MKKNSWLYIVCIGLLLGASLTLMQWGRYRWMVIDHSFEMYAILVALVFTALGIWAGNQFMKRKTKVIEKVVEIEKEVRVQADDTFDKAIFLQKTGITERELEVLQLIVKGFSNQEIADSLFLSLSTVKTHISSIFLKLEVSRRTQAMQKARQWGLQA